MENIKPLEVVQVQPTDYYLNQHVANTAVGLVQTFLTPLAVRAVARNFGWEMGYWKSVRTTWAIQFIARSVLPGGYKPPPARGSKTITEWMKARDEARRQELLDSLGRKRGED